jgi:hypothetical protein
MGTGTSPVWTRIDVGGYRLTFAGGFPLGKTFWTLSKDTSIGDIGVYQATRTSDTIDIYTYVYNGPNTDGLLTSTPIEILVYP